MVNTIMIFIWGALDSLLIYKVLRTLVTYEFNRHREKKLRAEAVYVMRTNRYEILLYALVILPFSIGAFLIHLWKDVGFHFAFGFIGLGMIGFLCSSSGTPPVPTLKSRPKESKGESRATIRSFSAQRD